jgi:aldehyde:ferredoxin oxidoreductase
MDKLGGYAGTILEIDLSTRRINKVPLTKELITTFLGGAGINARLAYDRIAPHSAPLSPENVLILGAGPLVGTMAPGASKSNITSKSPSSGFFGTSGSGDFAMQQLKYAGYDHVVISGKADRPVYLKIDQDVEIRDAGHLWGKDTWAVTDAVWGELGRQYGVLAIGPAGENLVRDASVIGNKYSAFARTGMGAVMGSKNLKAFAVSGTGGVTVADPKRFARLATKLYREVQTIRIFRAFRQYGTLLSIGMSFDQGIIPFKNHREFPGPEYREAFALEKLMQGIDRSARSCPSCPVGCKHSFLGREEGEFKGLKLPISCAVVPFEQSVNCGAKTWLQSLEYGEMCNRLGMDALSISGVVAMAMELYERGVITQNDTGGLALEWNADTLLRLVRDIAYRRGFGNVLADGLIDSAQQIGRGAEDCALHFKGLSGGDPRPLVSTVWFGTVTNATGHASHINGTYFGQTGRGLARYCRRVGMADKDLERILEGSTSKPQGYKIGRLTKWAEDYSFALECLGFCQHGIYQEFDIGLWAEFYSAATGIELDGAGLLAAAGRGRDMRKAFNLREGATRKDDRIPRRFLTESLRVGDAVYPPLNSADLDQWITEYYEERGWDPLEGTLNPQRIAELTAPATAR